MKTATTFRIGVIVVILGCLLYLFDSHLARKQTVRVQVERVFDITTDPVTTLVFERGESRVELVRKQADWFIQEPLRARANKPRVERMVAVIEALKRQDVISLQERQQRGLSLSDYGLENTSHRLYVETSAGRPETLLIGARAPFGQAVYGRIDHDDTVFTMPDSVLDLFPSDLAALRDRTLLYGSPAKTDRIDIRRHHAGFLQLVRRKSDWVLQQPLAAKADTAAVRELLDALFALRIARFHWDASLPEDAPDQTMGASSDMMRRGQFEAAGLADDSARLKITVWTEGDRLGQDILIGSNVAEGEQESFARRGGVDAVYTIPSDIIALCSRPADAFRSRSVFDMSADDVQYVKLEQGDQRLELERVQADQTDAWLMRTPLRCPAERAAVEGVIAKLLELRVVEFLDDQDTFVTDDKDGDNRRITLAKGIPSDVLTTGGAPVSKPVEQVALILAENSHDDVFKAARLADQQDVFTLAASAVAPLHQMTVSPIYFRDRLMLTIDPASVARIEVVTRSNRFQVIRDSADLDVWTCSQGLARDALDHSVGDLLQAASRIEAARFESFMPSDLGRYGLDHPAARITFGFLTEEKLQNVLLLGDQTDDAWRYAMVQGRDFVFLLAEPQCQVFLKTRCVRDTTVPASSGKMPAAGAVSVGNTNAAGIAETTSSQERQAP